MIWEPIEGSHLGIAVCGNCGKRVLCVQGKADVAFCETCAQSATGAGAPYVGLIEPVRGGYPIGLGPLAALEEPAPYPVPTVTSRDSIMFMEGVPAPAPVLSLAEFAREHGWEIRTQYSRGHMPHGSTGKPLAERHLIGLRFGAHPMTERQAYAVYVSPVKKPSWSWDTMYIWGPDLPPFKIKLIGDLKLYLGGVAWMSIEAVRELVAEITDIRAAAEEIKKTKPAGTPKAREGMS